MTEYTKGPWVLDMEYLDINTQDGHLITEVHYKDDQWIAHKCIKTPEEMANATLIAGAPDMLEALEYCLELLGSEFDLPKIEAAITKAKGESRHG